MSSRCASASKRASTTVHGGGRPSACCISVVSFKPAPSAFPLLAHPDPAWRRARRRQGRCAPRKRGRLRPSLTAAARDALGWSGRDEETALSSRTKKHPRWGEPSRTARVRRSPQPTPNGEEAYFQIMQKQIKYYQDLIKKANSEIGLLKLIDEEESARIKALALEHPSNSDSSNLKLVQDRFALIQK